MGYTISFGAGSWGQIFILYKAPKIKCGQTFHYRIIHYPHYHYTFHLPAISIGCQVVFWRQHFFSVLRIVL
jgi:hypothetical protein